MEIETDLNTLKEMVRIINPKYLVPIHTFRGKSYNNIFKVRTLNLKDREEYIL
jgi:mRNA degradation ribonuclease J1/J2